ncbi:hypothetical protein ACTXT7_013453 [Hymenolepis weldensis]
MSAFSTETDTVTCTICRAKRGWVAAKAISPSCCYESFWFDRATKEHASGKSIKTGYESVDFDSTCAEKEQMAEDEEEKDVYLLELTIPPFENEFEEEQLRIDCEEALSKMPTHGVDSFEWRHHKAKVFRYKQYLQEKAEYLEKVKKDLRLSKEIYKKCLQLMEQLAETEKEANKNRRTTVSRSRHYL